MRFKQRFQTYWYVINDDVTIKKFSRKHNMPNILCYIDNHNLLIGTCDEEIQLIGTVSGIKCMRICNKHHILHTDGTTFKK